MYKIGKPSETSVFFLPLSLSILYVSITKTSNSDSAIWTAKESIVDVIIKERSHWYYTIDNMIEFAMNGVMT